MDISVVSVKVWVGGGAVQMLLQMHHLKREDQIGYVHLQTCGVSVLIGGGGPLPDIKSCDLMSVQGRLHLMMHSCT